MGKELDKQIFRFKQFEQYTSIYFLGIGGIGMSALARYFNENGYDVSGYDKTATPLTIKLSEEGIEISYVDDVNFIPDIYSSDEIEKCLCVYTPAVPMNSNLYIGFKNSGITFLKRSQVLNLFTDKKYCLAVAGTHGKTSTTTLSAHILKSVGINFISFLGGISANYDNNYIYSDNETNAPLVLVEADEYDRSFLALHPDEAVITAIEPDHLDIYGTYEDLQEAYNTFASQVKGNVWVEKNFQGRLSKPSKSYSVNEEGNAFAENIIFKDGVYHFDYQLGKRKIENIMLPTPGRHNIENTVAAISLTIDSIGWERKEEIKQAIATYKGVKRRFEIIINEPNLYYVDDYAHHPTEIKVTLDTLKEMFPKRKITLIFQPHLFTRTRDLLQGFADSLSMADTVIILPIYPARELPIEGIDSQLLVNEINKKFKKGIKAVLVQKIDLLQYLSTLKIEVIATLGAGDIDKFVPRIKELLLDK